MSLKGDIDKIIVKELDRVADKAVVIMRAESPQRGKNPWTTGALAASVHKEVTGERERVVGSWLYYAKFVQDGRGVVRPKRVYHHPWDEEPSLYMKGLGFWLRPGQPANSAPAQHIVEKTLAKLK